jgi:hypothetical protein
VGLVVHHPDGIGATLSACRAYPDPMSEETNRRSSSDPPADSAPAVRPTAERSGPLALERLRKADGRLLILYARQADPEGEGS